MDAEAIRRALRRIAHEIIEGNPNLESVVLAGIPSRGVEIARRIAAFIREIEKTDVDTGVIDVAMHRDDVGTRKELPVVHASKLPVPLEDRTVIIVDDVLYTGRTVRAAMDAINSFGRPARIQLAVLVDRGHRELPIRPDYVGKNLPTATREQIQVRLQETDNEPDGVYWKSNEQTDFRGAQACCCRTTCSPDVKKFASECRQLQAWSTIPDDYALDTQGFTWPARADGRRNQFRSRDNRRV